MKSIFFLTFFAFLLSSFCFSQETKIPRVHISQKMENELVACKNDSLKNAFNVLKDIIISPSEDMILGNHIYDKSYKNLFFQMLMLDYSLRNKLHYYILESDTLQNGFVFKVMCQLYISKEDFGEEEGNDYNEIICISNLYIKQGKWDIDYKKNLKNYHLIKQGKINYFTKETKSFNVAEAKKAKKFCDSIANIFGITKSQIPDLNYILSNENRTDEIFGAEYTFNEVGRFIKPDLLLSNGKGENYRHELVHYVLQNYQLPNFFSEGLAVWFGGSGNESDFKKYVEKSFSRTGNPTQNTVLNLLYNKAEGRESFDFFYPIAALSVDFVFQKKGIQGLKQLVQMANNADINPIEIIKKITQKKENEIVEFIHNYN